MSVAAVPSQDTLALPANERLDIVRQSYLSDPKQMTAVLARQYQLPEVDVIRALPEDQFKELDLAKWEDIIRSFENVEGQDGNNKVHVIFSNGSGVLEVFGEFGGFSEMGPYFNVHTKTLDMHLLPKTFAHIFAVEKPGHGKGKTTLSIQFYNTEGKAAFKVFLTMGEGEPKPARRELWERLRADYAKA